MYKNIFLRGIAIALLLLSALSIKAETATWPADTFQILCYHEVRDDAWTLSDPYAINTKQLSQQFEWLKENKFNVISIDDIMAARAGKKSLPPKAVLLTFDDGYKSFYTNVFPLLKTFNYRAVQAVVGSWIDAEPNSVLITAEAHNYTTDDMLSWKQIKEMSDSGLVEIASHSHTNHIGIRANPQGSMIPSLVTHRYLDDTNEYESNRDYLKRIQSDLRTNSALIKKHTGKNPRVMVWPYGRYNQALLDTAKDTGMPITLTLNSGVNSTDVPLNELRRILITSTEGDGIAQLDRMLRASYSQQPPIRVMHVDLDYVYDPDPSQQQANLGKLLDRVKASGANTVFLQAFSDADASGSAQHLYFPNRHMPVRADLFSYVAWQLQVRTNVNVYAWMPLSAFRLPSNHPQAGQLVTASNPKGANNYVRLSPFNPDVQKVIKEIYEDLGTHAIFNGILFHDDSTLTDYEDDSPAARTVYKSWGLPGTVDEIRSSPEAFRQWSTKKTEYLTNFSLQLANHLKPWQPKLKTARNMYARVILEPISEEWYAQSLPNFLSNYDFTAIMAMPYLENAAEPLPWLHKLVRTVAQTPNGLEKSVFELQALDWRTQQPIPSKTLAKQMETLLDAGARSYGYYPDDFPRDEPRLEDLVDIFSLRGFPYRSGK